MLFGRRQDALESDDEEIVDQVCADVFGPRPMYSCSNRVIPAQMVASISPCVFMASSLGSLSAIARSQGPSPRPGRPIPGHYIPPFTMHQHFAKPGEECRIIVMSNRIVKDMGFDWYDQVEHAPGF